ncbi:MAG: aminotransferase class I/II-fold pyridoxal phosphate-dependent enzyme [Gammaproteobacteria bacterium]|nr:aminotransferase class I/II-fold pyridoxal phosphate-dependent enzyme [Gammaproteobacteria bacterium]
MDRTIDSKLPDVGTTIFTVMSQLANHTGAINLAQGFPSFEPPDALLDRISHYLHNGANQYAPMMGVPALREAIAEKTLRLQNRKVDMDSEITVCCGATEGLFSAIQAVVRPADEVIVFDPAYDSYEPAVTLAGGLTRHIPLTIGSNGHDFEIDWAALSAAIGPKTRLIVLNFPHNPTGAILQPGDLDKLAALLRDTDCFLLSDEVYEHIVFEGKPHLSLLSHDELWERTLVISSFGKTFHATGWKIGYCIAPAYLSDEFRKVHQFTTFAISTPVQHAIADFLRSDPDFYSRLPEFYRQKRDRFCELLQGSRFLLQPARSTFFQILDYSEISQDNDLELAQRWTRDIGVASIPLTVFCEQPFTAQRLRFCFAKDDATLSDAAAKLCAL